MHDAGQASGVELALEGMGRGQFCGGQAFDQIRGLAHSGVQRCDQRLDVLRVCLPGGELGRSIPVVAVCLGDRSSVQ